MLTFINLLVHVVQAWPNESNPLPVWADHSREPVLGRTRRTRQTIAPPPTNFRVPAEYEPTGVVVLGWKGLDNMLEKIAHAAALGDASVWAIQGPSYIWGIDQSKYKSISLELNTNWMRDYGPVGMDHTGKVAVVDTIYQLYRQRPLDDEIPTQLANLNSYESYKAPLVLDGGNYMLDSKGNLFMTKRTYNWNYDLSDEEVDAALRDYFGAKKVHAIEYAGYPDSPTDSTGHIDMFAKLLNDETVLISTAQVEPYKSNGEKAIEYFKSIKTPSGNPYKILTLEGWEVEGTWYTYTNSLIVNNVVIVPSYTGKRDYEVTVKNVYQEGIPGVNVQFVHSESSIVLGGSIHCMTQTIPRV